MSDFAQTELTPPSGDQAELAEFKVIASCVCDSRILTDHRLKILTSTDY